MKAYSKIYGKVIDPQYIDGATDELVTTGSIAEALGDPEKAAQLIAAVKEIIGIELTEEQKQQIISLMQKIAALDIDAATLTEQAKGIYEDLKSSGLDLSQYGITDEEVNGFWALLKSLLERILSIFRGEG